ncbi:MAG: phosphoribosyltransferase [Anaerolineae bacterium]
MFKDRRDAANKLATKLLDFYGKDNFIVLGISSGGMITANEVARQLNVPSDMLNVCKLRVPDHQTEPMGAIAIGGNTSYNTGIIQHFKVPQNVIEEVEGKARQALKEQVARYRDNAPLDVSGRSICLVDDGMGTGVTMRAAIDAMKAQGASEIIVASPVSSMQVCMMFHGLADRTICYATPQPFHSVEKWYDDFDKPTDDEIRALIREGQAQITS